MIKANEGAVWKENGNSKSEEFWFLQLEVFCRKNAQQYAKLSPATLAHFSGGDKAAVADFDGVDALIEGAEHV